MKKISGQDANSAEETMENYNEQLYKLNRKVVFEKGNIKFETVIKGVSNEGRLLTVDAIERGFDFGEVEWVL
jgi:BirA family biotin operon repressor/biotin-[acetyl-CoA-carboxylase] ligase